MKYSKYKKKKLSKKVKKHKRKTKSRSKKRLKGGSNNFIPAPPEQFRNNFLAPAPAPVPPNLNNSFEFVERPSPSRIPRRNSTMQTNELIAESNNYLRNISNKMDQIYNWFLDL